MLVLTDPVEQSQQRRGVGRIQYAAMPPRNHELPEKGEIYGWYVYISCRLTLRQFLISLLSGAERVMAIPVEAFHPPILID